MFKPLQTLSRKAYGWSIVAAFGLSIAFGIAAEFYPPIDKFSSAVSTGVAAALAIFTGARLADAGYSRWIGIAGIVGIVLVLPVAITIIFVAAFGRIDHAYVIILVVIVCLPAFIGFAIWAGTRRPVIRADHLADVFGEVPERRRERIEPHF